MSHEPQQSRRRLLAAIAGGSGVYAAAKVLPERWARPVVDSVSLPVHAQTSASYFAVLTRDLADASPAGRDILDLILPTADAAPISTTLYICVTPSGDYAQVDIVLSGLIVSPGSLRASGMVPIAGSKAPLEIVDVGQNCAIKKTTIEAKLSSLAKGKIFIGGTTFVIDFNLPMTECNLPAVTGCLKPGP